MIDFLIEGNTNIKQSSEYQFWDLINKNILGNKLNIIACGGIDNVIKIVDGVYAKNKQPVIANIDNGIQFPEKLVRLSNVIKDNNAINVYRGKLIGFEDLFLQFSYFLYWIFSVEFRNKQKFKDIENLVKDYKEYLYKDKEDSELLKKFIDRYHNSDYNLSNEQLSAALLGIITYNYCYQKTFKISKGEYGPCWSNNCFDKNICCLYHTENNKRVLNNIDKEHRCGLFANKKNIKDKLLEFYNYSQAKDLLIDAKKYFNEKGILVNF